MSQITDRRVDCSSHFKLCGKFRFYCGMKTFWTLTWSACLEEFQQVHCAMEEVFAQWAAVCALKTDAPNLFVGESNFHELRESTNNLMKKKKSISDSFFVILVHGLNVLLGVDFVEHNEAEEFLIELLLSSSYSEAERALLIQIAKTHIPAQIVFNFVKYTISDFLRKPNKISEAESINDTIRILQVLVSF
jgi:hypothetical protein